ncbi:MAG: hypothetical protein ABIF71_02835 [Planctomycetota bacterium]
MYDRKENTMRANDRTGIKRRLAQLHKQLAALGPIMRGSVVVIGTRNKQPYFSLNHNGKTRLIYLGRQRLPQAQECSQNHQKLKIIVDEMTKLNMLLLKKDW